MKSKLGIKEILKSKYGFTVVLIITVLIAISFYVFFNNEKKIEKEISTRINSDENQYNDDSSNNIINDNLLNNKSEGTKEKLTLKEQPLKSIPDKKKNKQKITTAETLNKSKKIVEAKEINTKGVNKDPNHTVGELHAGLKKISDGKLDNYAKVLELIKNTYDTHKMTGMIVGNIWQKLSSEKQNELKKVFVEYIAKNYLKRFRKMTNIKFEKIETQKINEDFRMVKTVLNIDNSENINIDYLLIKTKNKWKIFDVLLAGSVSEIATKKSEFSNFINDSSIDKLIEALKKKNLTILK